MEVDEVAAALLVRRVPEVVEPDLVERRQRLICGDVTAEPMCSPLRRDRRGPDPRRLDEERLGAHTRGCRTERFGRERAGTDEPRRARHEHLVFGEVSTEVGQDIGNAPPITE